MMPELGKYTDTVLSAYVATIVLLTVLVLASVWRGRRVRARLKETEQRVGRRHG